MITQLHNTSVRTVYHLKVSTRLNVPQKHLKNPNKRVHFVALLWRLNWPKYSSLYGWWKERSSRHGLLFLHKEIDMPKKLKKKSHSIINSTSSTNHWLIDWSRCVDFHHIYEIPYLPITESWMHCCPFTTTIFFLYDFCLNEHFLQKFSRSVTICRFVVQPIVDSAQQLLRKKKTILPDLLMPANDFFLNLLRVIVAKSSMFKLLNKYKSEARQSLNRICFQYHHVQSC